MVNKLKTLVLDIETMPILAWVWDLKDQNISLSQICRDQGVGAWAAKWLGDPPSKIMYRDNRNKEDAYDDKALIQDLWKLLNEADIVITQNGESFDAPKLNARFITYGMKPPAPYRHLDTYRIVKRVAKFTSNKLEYLTAKLNKKYKKLSHSKFPGWSLWIECISGNREAWEEMKKYNIHDVLSTEELYENLKPWAPETMAKPFEVTDASTDCGTCGYFGTMIKGKLRRAKTYIYHQHQCPECGAFQTGERVKKEDKDGK